MLKVKAIRHLSIISCEAAPQHFNHKQGSAYCQLDYTVTMRFKSASLEFSVEVGEIVLGRAEVEYNHGVPELRMATPDVEVL